jgi:hypothetical protein
MMHFFFLSSSALLFAGKSKRKKSDRRRLGKIGFLRSVLTLSNTTTNLSITHRSNNTTRSSSSVYGETLVFVVVVFFRASVGVGSQECEGNVRRLIGRFFCLGSLPLSLSCANFWLRVIYTKKIKTRKRYVLRTFFLCFATRTLRTICFCSQRERERERGVSLSLEQQRAYMCDLRIVAFRFSS